ncbi:MAG: hypothetical protein H6601_00730 [Flavobacteriales bacterium]|nr:hypothetical protein [Flavobacteriales bacterium]
MNLIDHTTTWVNGEVLQGKIMLGLGILLLLGSIAIFKSDHELLKGSLIPLALLTAMLCGYGGFQIFGRPPHIQAISEIYSQNPKAAIEKEITKAEKDDGIYGMAKKVWIVLLVIAAIASLFIVSDFYRGLTLGFMVLFLAMLIIDTTLHHRLQAYLEALKQLT